jgi:hypothetical protein
MKEVKIETFQGLKSLTALYLESNETLIFIFNLNTSKISFNRL